MKTGIAACCVFMATVVASPAQIHPDTDPATLPGPTNDLTGTEYGRALIFLDDPIDWEATAASGNWTNPVFNTPTEVLLSNMGIYDTNGVMAGTNGGKLDGKYGFTDRTNGTLGQPDLDPFTITNNDFRIDYTGITNGMPRESLVWASEASFYFHVTDFRVRFFTDSFIDQLGIPDPQIVRNLKHLQYRPDLIYDDTILTRKPRLVASERPGAVGLSLWPGLNDEALPLRTRGPVPVGPGGFGDELFPISFAFAREALVGDYAGLMAFWIPETNKAWPSEDFFTSTSVWTQNILPALNDGLSRWVAHRISGKDEVYRYFQYGLRLWDGIPCGDGTNIACNAGVFSRNVMMFDEADTSRNGVFPYQNPAGGTDTLGPRSADLAAGFFVAVFYDIAYEAGLGVHKTDLLLWKTVSLIDNMDTFPMRTFGATVQQAARLLWPDGGGLSIYEDDINDVMTSRGVPLNGVGDFRDNLPAAIGDFASGTLERSSANRFGSSQPDSQPDIASGGAIFNFWNGYIHPDTNVQYVAYQFYKHSKYGPCDVLALTDGTFTTFPDGQWNYNSDGTFYTELTDRSLGNLIAFSPASSVRWMRSRKRCDTEAVSPYYEDVRPFGFRCIKATPNGFSFTVEELAHAGDPLEKAFLQSGELFGVKTYRCDIVDPSLRMMGDADYAWTVTDHLGVQQTGSGMAFIFDVLLDQPFTIHIERTRGAQVDTLELRERANDFGRSGGRAFVYDATGALGPPPSLGIALTTNQQIEVSWPNTPPDFIPQEGDPGPPPSWTPPGTGTVHEAAGLFRYRPGGAESNRIFRLMRP